jgi:hypothetical protein
MATTGKRPTGGVRQPWDPANGLRIGALGGALVGGAIVALSGVLSFWIVAGSGVVGGGIGYWNEKKKQRAR